MKRRLSIKTITVTLPLALFAAIIFGNAAWTLLDVFFFQTQKACATTESTEKSIAFSILRMQGAFHYETGTFLSDIDQLINLHISEYNKSRSGAVEPYQEGIGWRGFYFGEDSEKFLAWEAYIKNYGNYATVNVLPRDPDKPSRLSYTGAISRNASEENSENPYKFFMCSAVSSNALPELHPVSESGGELKFECPKGTREDC